jgi:hypothetical protein
MIVLRGTLLTVGGKINNVRVGAGLPLKGGYDPLAVFFFRIDIHDVSPGCLYVTVPEELAHQLNVVGIAVKPGRNRPADIMCGLGRFDPCACAEFPDPITSAPSGAATGQEQ